MAVERKWVIFIFMCLLIIGGFIVGNRLWFYPTYTAKIPAIPYYTPPTVKIDPKIIKPFEGTLRKILQQEKVAGLEPPETSRHRNPFIWEGELEPKVKQVKKKQKQVKRLEVPRLAMIMFTDTQRSAILDKTLVHPGDLYAGHTVEEIGKKHVILAGVYGVIRLQLPERSFGPPTIEVLEATNPDLLIKPVWSNKDTTGEKKQE